MFPVSQDSHQDEAGSGQENQTPSVEDLHWRERALTWYGGKPVPDEDEGEREDEGEDEDR